MHVSLCPPERVPLSVPVKQSHSLAVHRCWKDYDGKRCEIHILFSITGQSGGAGLTQTVQIIIGVVLLAISCLAILLMAYAQ